MQPREGHHSKSACAKAEAIRYLAENHAGKRVACYQDERGGALKTSLRRPGSRRAPWRHGYLLPGISLPRRSGLSKNDAIDIAHPNPFGGWVRNDWDWLAHWRSTLNERENR
jgi:hypothetical protein